MAREMIFMEEPAKSRAAEIIKAISEAMTEEHELRGGRIVPTEGYGTLAEVKEKAEMYSRRSTGQGKLFVNVGVGYKVAKVFHESKKRPDLPVKEIAAMCDETVRSRNRSRDITFKTEALRDATVLWLEDQGLSKSGYGAEAIRYELYMVRNNEPEAKIRINGTVPVELLPEFLKLWEKFIGPEVTE